MDDRQVSTLRDLPLQVHRANRINGRWEKQGDGTFNTVLHKYTGEVLAELPHASAAQMDKAIGAARDATRPMAQFSAGDRSRALERLAVLIETNKDALARLIMMEAGKPITYAEGEVARAITTTKLAAAEALRHAGEVVVVDHDAGKGRQAFTRRYPIGPVACITPFNFPLNLVMHKVAPALAAGCPVVLKPAPQAPLTALALGQLIAELDLPDGAFQVLVCGNDVAEHLVKDERMSMLSFTGSDKVGWHLKAICGKKRVALELGGNAAVVVDESAELATTARLIARGAYLYAGQICISTQRIFVASSVFDRFQDLLVKEIAALRSGDPADPQVSNGPLIDHGHFERIGTWVQEAIDGGAEVRIGARPLDPDHHIYAPTLLSGTTDHMKVNSEEVFGPVAILERSNSYSEALDRVNDSRFGLQAGVFTNDLAHVKEAHEKLCVGGIMINDVPGFRVDGMPYGGVKDSGLGREGVRYAMAEMTEPRLLVY
ncbi:MAG: aldehyde dehydrogenase family protein [Flavobacteriales bacterium]|nr:aldehyde dehydrogenase family protein [Flavobacteriales bacterium]